MRRPSRHVDRMRGHPDIRTVGRVTHRLHPPLRRKPRPGSASVASAGIGAATGPASPWIAVGTNGEATTALKLARPPNGRMLRPSRTHGIEAVLPVGFRSEDIRNDRTNKDRTTASPDESGRRGPDRARRCVAGGSPGPGRHLRLDLGSLRASGPRPAGRPASGSRAWITPPSSPPPAATRSRSWPARRQSGCRTSFPSATSGWLNWRLPTTADRGRDGIRPRGHGPHGHSGPGQR